MAHDAPLRQKRVVAEALRANAPTLRRFVSGRLPAADVDDVLQSAAARAVERSESLRDLEQVLPWLYRIHRNVVTDTLRQRGRLGPAAPDSEIEHQIGDDREDEVSCACSVAQAKRLSPSYAAVLTLVDASDLTLSEAANVLGISINNATVRLHRARKALRSAMLNHCGVQSARDCIDCRCVFDGCCET